MKSKFLASGLAILHVLTPVIRADMAAGVDWHVANAEVIALVEADEGPSTAVDTVWPAEQPVKVKEILKGVDFSAGFRLFAHPLKPGDRALLLFQYKPATHDEPTVDSKAPNPPVISVWPVDAAGKIDTGDIPPETISNLALGRGGNSSTLAEVKAFIAAGTPEQVGLNRQVLAALLFPEEGAALAKADPARARYLQLTIALLDLHRDAPALRRLLDSSDAAVRAAAAKKLEALTGPSAPSMKQSRWPPVPATTPAPPDPFPKSLLAALDENDPAAFAAEFPAWLDSGVVRDRQIWRGASLERTIIRDCNLSGAIGGESYLPPAPRLRPDVMLDQRLPAEDRMLAIALFAETRYHARFARERREAVTALASVPLNSDLLRRAAFWEMRDVNFNTAGRVALRRLRDGPQDEALQRFLLRICLEPIIDDPLDVIRSEIKAQRQPFLKEIFDYAESHRDHNALWIGRLLCQEHQTAVIPTVISWLKDPDPEVRKTAALNLCWLPDRSAVEGLLGAIESEQAPEVKRQMLISLAQTGDPRGLETLLAAMRNSPDPQLTMEIARGLGRIRDEKALPILAKIVARTAAVESERYVLEDAANSFDYIAKFPGAYQPPAFWGGPGVERSRLQSQVQRIEAWRRVHPD